MIKKRRLLGPLLMLTLLVILPGGAPASGAAEDPLRVLFVGNSLTTAHNIPGLVAELALSAGQRLDYRVYAPGGHKLMHHAKDDALHQLIRQQPWNYVVLQEQSQLPAFGDGQVRRQVLPHARRLVQLIRQNNSRTKIVFYMTMAHQNGDRRNARTNPAASTYPGMQQRLARSYLRMAKENRAVVAPVGIAWERLRLDKPVIGLYADDVHPNATGAYLAACVLYATIFGDTPVGLFHPQTISPNKSRYLQETAGDTVFDSRHTWRWD